MKWNPSPDQKQSALYLDEDWLSLYFSVLISVKKNVKSLKLD